MVEYNSLTGNVDDANRTPGREPKGKQMLTTEQKRIGIAVVEFVGYVHSFYGTDGVYDMGATRLQICEATKILIEKYENVEFDSLDRERVRDILIEKYNLKFPEPDTGK